MANIPLLYPGCTAQDILDTINALIAAITGGAGQSISYNDLSDKPTLNGVEINGDQTTDNLKIKIAETADFGTYNEAWASKAYVDAVEAAAVAAAQNATNAALANKLDKNLSNLDAVTHMGDGAYIPIITPNGIVKVSTEDLVAYIGIKSRVENSSIEMTIKSQRDYIVVTTVADGRITRFSVQDYYTLGTSAVYLNGNRLYAGRDYVEVNSRTFEFIGRIPTADDNILFEAIPLATTNPNQESQYAANDEQ